MFNWIYNPFIYNNLFSNFQIICSRRKIIYAFYFFSGKTERNETFLHLLCYNLTIVVTYTAISRKVVGKSARDNPERYCGWFWIHCCPKKFKKRIREATDVCLRELKESNKSRFDSYSVRNSVSIISHITFRDCRVHIFSDNLSRNSWM